MVRGAVWAAAILAVGWWAGCSGGDGLRDRDDPIDPVCAREGLAACVASSACGSGEVCRDGCCAQACAGDEGCAAAPGCGPLGCFCDEGACVDRPCSSHGDCPEGTICRAGSCEAPQPAETIASCELAPRWAVLRSGARLRLHLHAADADGEPVPWAAGASFASDRPATAEVDGSGRVEAGAEAGTAVVTASIGAATCRAEILVHAPAPEGALRVLLVDETTGLPIEGAPVQLETTAGPRVVLSGPDGAALFPAEGLPPPPRTLSVFSPDHAWITVVGTAASDLLLPLRRLEGDGRVGGFAGSFGPDSLFHPEEFHVGIAGTSIPGNLIDLSFSLLLGPAQPTRVTVGGPREVEIPSGTVLGLGNTWFKERYFAPGAAGTCADRERTASGTCGTAAAWGIAGGVPLLDLPIDSILLGGRVEMGPLLAKLLPRLAGFRSAVRRDVRYELHPLLDGQPDWSRFTPVDLEARTPMSLAIELRLPRLPAAGGALDGAIAIGAARLPGRGVVPLGFTAGLDADRDAGEVPDGWIGNEGRLPLRLAPQHGGLEGSDWILLALAANFAEASEGCAAPGAAGCAAIAGLVERLESLPEGRVVDLRGEGFVAPASGSGWDPASRTFVLDRLPEGGANLIRLRLAAPGGRLWHLWMEAAVGSVQLPVPANLAEDRARGASASVQALRVGSSLDQLLAAGEGSLGDLTGLLSGFSSIELPDRGP